MNVKEPSETAWTLDKESTSAMFNASAAKAVAATESYRPAIACMTRVLTEIRNSLKGGKIAPMPFSFRMADYDDLRALGVSGANTLTDIAMNPERADAPAMGIIAIGASKFLLEVAPGKNVVLYTKDIGKSSTGDSHPVGNMSKIIYDLNDSKDFSALSGRIISTLATISGANHFARTVRSSF